jgi:predicted nucleic acid-binding protein
MRPRSKQKSSSETIYIDINVLYYYLSAHPQFGERARSYIATWGGNLVTSSLSAWILYVLTRLENITSILDEVGVTLVPLTASIMSGAEKLEKPRDFEDRIHVATMLELGIDTIVSNDKDFDGLVGIKRIF